MRQPLKIMMNTAKALSQCVIRSYRGWINGALAPASGVNRLCAVAAVVMADHLLESPECKRILAQPDCLAQTRQLAGAIPASGHLPPM